MNWIYGKLRLFQFDRLENEFFLLWVGFMTSQTIFSDIGHLCPDLTGPGDDLYPYRCKQAKEITILTDARIVDCSNQIDRMAAIGSSPEASNPGLDTSFSRPRKVPPIIK